MFSGIGGFEKGIEQATGGAFRCVGFSEIDKFASSVYQYHFNHRSYGDAARIVWDDVEDFELFVGGFPCQAFSIAGKRKGFDDTRGTLFFEIARALSNKQPMLAVLENVKGLVSHDNGKTLKTILETLQSLGYYTNYEIVNSKNFGVPQNRERIFFLCKHVKCLISVGQNKKITICESIIQEYLFQVLLNNLDVVEKLQEHASKDYILGYLLSQEINRNHKSKGKNIKDTITIPMAFVISQLEEKEVWQNIDTWLKKNWEENYKAQNTYTTSTVIKKIIESKTYTYAMMFQAIASAILHLRNSQKNLWSEILSNLMLVKEDTKYARITYRNEEIIITENNALYLCKYFQDISRHFIVGHLRDGSCGQVFPITGNDAENYTPTLIASYYKGYQTTGPMIKSGTWRTHKDGNGFREIKDGNAPTIPARAREDGSGQPCVAIPVLTQDRVDKRQNGRRFKEDGEPSFTLTAQDRHGVMIPEATKQGYAVAKEGDSINLSCIDSKTRRGRVGVGVAQTLDTGMQQHTLQGGRIRRLTPIECERLQGFPDGWTKCGAFGIKKEKLKKDRMKGGVTKKYQHSEISDTQRYKCLGNAVTVNVIEAIFRRIIELNYGKEKENSI